MIAYHWIGDAVFLGEDSTRSLWLPQLFVGMESHFFRVGSGQVGQYPIQIVTQYSSGPLHLRQVPD